MHLTRTVGAPWSWGWKAGGGIQASSWNVKSKGFSAGKYSQTDQVELRRHVLGEKCLNRSGQRSYWRRGGKAQCGRPWWKWWLREAGAAAAAAKSLQLCLTLCDPIDGSPPGSPVPGILQARTLEWVAISFSNALKWKVKMKSLSCAWLLATPWTAAFQAPPSMGFSRQEYWSGLPLPYLVANDCV